MTYPSTDYQPTPGRTDSEFNELREQLCRCRKLAEDQQETLLRQRDLIDSQRETITALNPSLRDLPLDTHPEGTSAPAPLSDWELELLNGPSPRTIDSV